MQLSTLSLLLVLLAAATIIGNQASDTGLNTVERARSTNILGKYRIYGDVRQSSNHRQKRTMSPFLKGWKSILKSTVSVKSAQFGSLKLKMFAKVGTSDNAIADFNLLAPKRVVKIPGVGLVGRTGNQEIIVTHNSNAVIMYMTNISNPKTPLRLIVYAENRAEAKAVINELKNIYFPRP